MTAALFQAQTNALLERQLLSRFANGMGKTSESAAEKAQPGVLFAFEAVP